MGLESLGRVPRIFWGESLSKLGSLRMGLESVGRVPRILELKISAIFRWTFNFNFHSFCSIGGWG